MASRPVATDEPGSALAAARLPKLRLAGLRAVGAERFSLPILAARIIDIAHRKPVRHVFLQIAKHRGAFFGNKYGKRSPISGDKFRDEIAVLRTMDVDHCAHVITRSLIS
jgi:hypothetical protein